MSYQERRVIITLITSLLIFILYGLYIYNRNGDMILADPNNFRFWGKAFLWLIPVTIVVQIIVQIVFVISQKIIHQEDDPGFSDERDKLIELKAIRISHWVFITGFILAMIAMAWGFQPWVMFVLLFTFGLIASIASELSKIYFYRKGL